MRKIGGANVKAKVWRRRDTYTSFGTTKDTCKALLKRGCKHIGSRCVKKFKNKCIEVENTYRCPDKVSRLRRSRLTGDTLFCLDGICHDVSFKTNKDMMEVLSKMAIFKEMQKSLKNKSAFKGSDKRCSKSCFGYSNCCQTSGKGWGHSIGLKSCSSAEKDLALMRGKNQCRYIGTYCSQKIKLGLTKVCLKKKSTFCCFGTQLTYLIQEQGRKQLGLGWGSAKTPQCRGLTFDELAKLDFDTLDLSAAFDDIQKDISAPDMKGTMKRFENSYRKRMPSLKRSKNPNTAIVKPLKKGESL